uniref:GatB/YqeY domain-containing protein n=1 Tax=Acidobacterium capsulatum TaxID=33075 RepID=A0A7V4XV74_9BACT
MSLVKQIDTDTIAAMKAKDAERTGVLRMVKAAFKTREIEKREPLTDTEAQQVLTTMIKQRRESIDQFQKGGRADLAEKEAWEITVIEAYMPKAASEEEIRQLVEEAIAELAVSGEDLGPKDMGTAMKAVQARIQQKGLRADGRMVSEMVKARLAK